VLLAYGGRDKPEDPALVELAPNAALRGVTIFYPKQRCPDVVPYPPAVRGHGMHASVMDVTLVNPYVGIDFTQPHELHYIRNVFGCPLSVGVDIDGCTDIGRVENCQLHCHWWSPELGGNWDRAFEYMWRNLEAFVFGRTDWEYVTNNFVFPTNIGYRFIQTAAGACNGHFTANGADACQVAVQVDAIQPMGLLITDGQFVAFNGDNPTGVLVNETCGGQVRLVNCNFWGAFRSIVVLKGPHFVGLSDCYFTGWDRNGEGLPAVDCQAGRLQMTGCSFDGGGLGLRLGPAIAHAIVIGNNGAGGFRCDDQSGGKAILRDNEPAQ